MRTSYLDHKQIWILINVVLMTLFLSVQTGLSQTYTIRVFGMVTDEGGAGLPQARIDIISQDREDTTSTQTDSSGAYSVQLILTETDVEENQSPIPSGFQLYQNYPNPFNPRTIIEFELPQPEHVKLTIYNIKGQVVKVLADGYYPAGLSRVHWDGSSSKGYNVAAGVYFYRIETKQFTETRKMLLLDGGGTEAPGRALVISRKSLSKAVMLSQETFTIRAEKEGYFIFVEDDFMVTSEDTAIEKNIVLEAEERIFFIRNVKNELSQICTMKPDGSDLKIISEFEFGYTTIGPIEARWSPDKSKIVVVGGPESSKEIFALWLMDMDGNLKKKLANNGMDPIWLSKNEIIYHKPRGYSIATCQDIFLVNIQNDIETKVYNQTDSLSIRIFDYSITDKCCIAYLSDKSLSIESIISKFKMENIINYTILYDGHTYRGVKPKLSPDEREIIFAKDIYRKNDLYSLELETNTLVKITDNPGEYRTLSWSPDREKIAFSKENSSLEGEFESTCDIFIVDLSSKQITNLTAALSDSISSHVMDWK